MSAHFSVYEFACSDKSDTVLVDSHLIEVLEQIRAHFGAPVHINSGYRTLAYNISIGEALVASIALVQPLISGLRVLTQFGSHCMYLPYPTLPRVVVLDIIAVLCLRADLFMLMCAPHAAAGSVNPARNISA